MTVVVDASAVVALVGAGDLRREVMSALEGRELATTQHMVVEAVSALRRQVAAGRLAPDVARLMLADLVALDVERFAFEPLLPRVWELRENVTPYDAAYVALAEVLDAPLLTLDVRLRTAPGPRCPFVEVPA